MNTSRIIRAVVGGGQYTKTAAITKEDYGRILKIEGIELPETYEIDFSNDRKEGTSVTMIGNVDGVLIPQQFIKSGKDIYAFYYHVGEDYGKTTYIFHIPNRLRPDRTDETPEPEQQSVIDQAIAALNTAVAQTAQDVLDADESAQASAESARASGESALSASNSALSSSEYASNALGHAESASESATASAQSASQAQTSAQTASEKAAQASSAESSAALAAQTATAKAIEAAQIVEGVEGYAQSAEQSAQSAAASATTASTKASEASQSASTASTKATEASQSATNAQTYANTAQAAQTAAETAQGKAEDAQAATESVAESIPSDYSQLSENVSELKSGFNGLTDGVTQPAVGVNIFDNVFDESGYINQGADATGSNFVRTSKYYEIADGKTVLYSYHESSGSNLSCTYAFYNASKEWVENKTFNNSIVSITLASGVKYFRVYKHKDMTDGITIAYAPIDHYIPYGEGYELKDGSVSYDTLDPDLQDRLDRVNELSDDVEVINSITEEKVGVNIFDENFDESGYINPTTGENASGSNFKRTSAFHEIPAENDGYLYYLATTAPKNFKVIYYKEDKTYAGRSTLDTYTERTATIASEAKYYRCYIDASYSGNIMLSKTYQSVYEPYHKSKEIKDNYIDYDMLKADVKEKMNTWLYGKTIVFMGDSIIGNFYDSTGICAKIADETGAEVINVAFGGSQMALRNTTGANLTRWNQLSGCKLCDAIATNDFTAQDDAVANLSGGLAYFSDRLATLKNVDWNTVDVVMWEWGVNDFQNELTVIKDESNPESLTSYYGGYCHFIETMLTAYPHLRLVAVTPMWRYWHDGDTYLYGSDEHEVAGQLLPDFAKCAIEVANKYHIPVIDNYFGMDANKWSRSQYFGTDSVHPKEEGRTRIAKRIVHILPTLL